MIDWSAQTLVHLVPPVIVMAASAGVGLWYRQRRVGGLLALLAKVGAVALLLSRGVFILQHGDTYGGDFAAMLDFTDGGSQPMVTLLAAFVMGTELTRQHAAMRRPVVVAVLVGALVWAGGTIATGAFAPLKRGMPTVAVRDLEGRAVHVNSRQGTQVYYSLYSKEAIAVMQVLYNLFCVETEGVNDDDRLV